MAAHKSVMQCQGGQSMFCRKCGTKLPENAQFCTECGAKVNDEADEKRLNATKENDKSVRKKFPKKTWIIIAVVAIVLICGGFLYNYMVNPRGVWLGNSNATVLDIESGGVGYFNEYGFSNYNDAITWKRTGFNKIQIKYTDNGEQSVFDAKLENGKLVTEDGQNWDAETYRKTNKSDNEAKVDVEKYMNPTMQSLIDSPKQHIWISATNDDEGIDKCFNSRAYVEGIYVTQNGKGTYYSLSDVVPINKFNKMTDDEVINYAKTHIDKDENHGKPSNDRPEGYKNEADDGNKVYQISFDRGKYQYTGFAEVSDPGTLDVSTNMMFLRINTPNKGSNIPKIQWVN